MPPSAPAADIVRTNLGTHTRPHQFLRDTGSKTVPNHYACFQPHATLLGNYHQSDILLEMAHNRSLSECEAFSIHAKWRMQPHFSVQQMQPIAPRKALFGLPRLREYAKMHRGMKFQGKEKREKKAEEYLTPSPVVGKRAELQKSMHLPHIRFTHLAEYYKPYRHVRVERIKGTTIHRSYSTSYDPESLSPWQ